MTSVPKLSESEWPVMKVIWGEHPINASRVIEALSETTSWRPKTIKTLLTRLVKKGAIGYDIRGREYHYYPMVAESAIIEDESRSFLRRVFGGAVKPMLAAMAESRELSLKDIEDLKRIVESRQES